MLLATLTHWRETILGALAAGVAVLMAATSSPVTLAIAGIAAAAVTGFSGWVVAIRRSRVEEARIVFQQSQEMRREMRAEIVDQRTRIEALEEENDRLRSEIRTLRDRESALERRVRELEGGLT